MQRSGFGWAYAETGGVARLRVSLSLAFYAEARPKLIQRRAYGYRNFQNYRLIVLIECGHIVI